LLKYEEANDRRQGTTFKKYFPALLITNIMQKSLIFLSGCAVQAFAAEPLLRFQGTSVSVDATAPAATPTVDPSTQSKFRSIHF